MCEVRVTALNKIYFEKLKFEDKAHQVGKVISKDLRRQESTSSRIGSRLNSAASSLGLGTASLFRKKSNIRCDANKEKMPVSDYDIDNIIQNVFKRQHLAEKEDKHNQMNKSFSKVSEESRHEHSLQRYSQMMSHWRKHNMHIAKRLKRNFKDSVIVRVDSYRRTKEIIDKLESEKSMSDTLNSSYAFKASLRSERKLMWKIK